jgi:hypothetical protein
MGWRGARSGRVREAAKEAHFFMSGNVLHRKTSLYTRSDTMLAEGDNVSWGCGGGLSLVAGIPPDDVGPGGRRTRGEGEGV